MTVLPTVRGQLLLAAERQATGPVPTVSRTRRWRPPAGTFALAVSVAVALGIAAFAVALLRGPSAGHPAGHVTHPPPSLLARPLHFPSLGPGDRCPTSSGYLVDNPNFVGTAFGAGPVRVLLGIRGDLHRARVELGRERDTVHSWYGIQTLWFGIQTLWFALPGYNGPFVVRASRLGAPGPIEVVPGGNGTSPGSGPLRVPAGPTTNTFPDGYRTVPGSTWIKSPGCYAWQVDGRGFSEVIVFDALRSPYAR